MAAYPSACQLPAIEQGDSASKVDERAYYGRFKCGVLLCQSSPNPWFFCNSCSDVTIVVFPFDFDSIF